MNEHDKKQRKRDVVRQISKGTGIATVALPGLMGMDSGVTALRDSLKENPNFVKSLKHHSKGIGKMMLKSMPSSAVCGVLGTGIGVALAGKPKSKSQQEKSASAMIDEHFEKVALFGLGKNNKSNPNKTKETWIDGVDVEDYDKHVNTAKSVYSKAKANNHLTQSGLNTLEQSNAESSTPFQWIGSRDFTDGNADTYINEYKSLMSKSACDIVEESFDKVAFNLGAVAKTVGNGIKSMATATKNLPNSIGNVKKLHNFATNTNLSQSTRNVAATARNKQIGNVAKGMALPAMGVAGAGMIGAGVNNALHNNNEKTAFDIVNDSFEKVAGTYYDFNAYKKRVNSKNVGSEKDYKSGFEYNKNYIFNNMLSDYMYGEHENEPVAEYLRNSTQGKPIGDGHMSNLMNRRQAKKMIKGYNKVRANAKVTDDNKEYLEQSDEFIKALGSARKDGNKRFVYTLG